MTTAKVLVFGSDTELLDRLRPLIERLGCQATCLRDLQPAAIPDLIGANVTLAVVHDAEPTNKELLAAFLDTATSGPSRLPVIVITEANQFTSMLDWMKLGAVDCLTRPLNLERLSLLIDSLTLHARRSCDSSPEWLTVDGAQPFCVASEESRQLAERLRQVADWDANVLITGETGTGKTHLAKLIHASSGRSREPFFAVNCAAIPEMLIESELFGHVRGAFTSATGDRNGVFSAVGAGTLFDEVDALPPSSQAKLLHAVDERTFSSVGSNRIQEFAGRLLTATNQDLGDLAKIGHFRQDLYYRLKVLSLQILPLRLRRCEIPHLAGAYIRSTAKRQACASKRLSEQALNVLQTYDWPGNVRELYNVLEHALAFCVSREILVEDFPASMRATISEDPPVSNEVYEEPVPDLNHSGLPMTGRLLDQARADGEAKILITALEENGHNRTKTASQLGISRSALYKRLQKLKQYGFFTG